MMKGATKAPIEEVVGDTYSKEARVLGLCT